MPLRPSQKWRSVHGSADECDESDQKSKVFKWNTENKIALFNGMIKRKPAGLHKHLNMLLVREDVSQILKKTVPTRAIWNCIHSYWNTEIADKMEKTVINIATGNFDLPKEKEWIQLIQEQKKTLNLNDKLSNSDANQAAINNVDLNKLKSVRVMVEKLDSYSLLVDCLKFNNILNWEKTLNNGLNNFHDECSSSKKFNSDIDVNCIQSNHIVNNKLVISQSLNSINLSTSEQLSKFKTQDLKMSKGLKLNNVIIPEPDICSRKNIYKLRSQDTSPTRISSRSTTHDLIVTEDIKIKNVMISKPSLSLKKKSYKLRSRSSTDHVPDKFSLSLRSKIKNSTNVSNLKSKKQIMPGIKSTKNLVKIPTKLQKSQQNKKDVCLPPSLTERYSKTSFPIHERKHNYANGQNNEFSCVKTKISFVKPR